MATSADDHRREEASGPGWQERFVDQRAPTTPSVASAVSESLSYIVIPEFATQHERSVLQESAQALQNSYMKHGDGDADIFRGIVVKWVTECSRYSVKELLDEDANAASDALLHRLLDFLEFGKDNNGDDELSELAMQVFGVRSNLQEKNAKWYDEMSYDKVSNPEPMVNIYETGGFFKRHEDGMHMTLLVVLEDADEGGGTAFYTSETDKEREEQHGNPLLAAKKPERIERPPVGTAMIWGAKLIHSALPVSKGSRTVYVGSFDLVDSGPDGLVLVRCAM